MGEWKVTGCNLCGIACNLEAYVEDNHITHIRPDAKGIRNGLPYCCRKGRASRYFQENPERLNYPQKKVGDHFERISWEQAFREIGERARAILDKHGPRSFAYIGGALASDQADAVISKFLLKAIGGQYAFNPIGIEFAGHWWSNGRILGHQGFVVEGDEKTAEAYIFWGSNSYVSHQILAARKTIRRMSESEHNKVIVVDPRLSETARMADMHIMPRPGSDAVLVRGLIALIIDRGWEDKEYLKKWCSDWEKARKWYVDFDYRKAFEVARVPFEQMEELAKIMTTYTWGVHQDLGIYFNRNNTITSFLLDSLCAITGNLLTKGNIVYDQYMPFCDPGDERDENVWRTVETGMFRVADSYPPAVLAAELNSEREDRIRMAFMSMSNPVMSFPDSPNLRKGLEKLELFVAIDCVPTETTQYADYVLPGKTGFEAYQFCFFSDESAYLKHPIIGQIAERKEDDIILMEIARSMGLVPEMPKSLYEAAAKSVKDRDILPFLIKVTAWLTFHPKYKDYQNLLLADALGRPEALGSVARACNRLACAVSPQGSTGFCDRAGFKPLRKYRFMEHLGPLKTFAAMSKMDQVFWAMDDNPHGVVIGVRNPDPEAYALDHIHHPDKKIHLFDETIDQHLSYITPECEEEALRKEMGDFPMILSAGNHADGGDNASMRNPDTYRFRKPFTVLVNPDDADRMGLVNGEEVMLTTRRGSIKAPVEISFRMAQGYCMIPHHYGMEKDGKVFYGAKANDLTRGEDIDPITHDPYLRWVPCRIDKIRSGI